MSLERKPTFLWRVVAAIFGFAILIAISPFAAKFLSKQFIVTEHWSSLIFEISNITGLVFSPLSIWVLLNNPSWPTPSEGKNAFLLLAVPLIGFAAGRGAIVALPLFGALMTGEQTEIAFTVESANESGTKRCRSPIRFKNLSFPLNEVCRVSDEVRRLLHPGDKVVIVGQGNRYGLFADELLLPK